MALHGEVKLNEDLLIIWSAQRTTAEVHEINSYQVIVYGEQTRWESIIEHRYSDGAAVLASKVLAEFATRKKEE